MLRNRNVFSCMFSWQFCSEKSYSLTYSLQFVSFKKCWVMRCLSKMYNYQRFGALTVKLEVLECKIVNSNNTVGLKPQELNLHLFSYSNIDRRSCDAAKLSLHTSIDDQMVRKGSCGNWNFISFFINRQYFLLKFWSNKKLIYWRNWHKIWQNRCTIFNNSNFIQTKHESRIVK